MHTEKYNHDEDDNHNDGISTSAPADYTSVSMNLTFNAATSTQTVEIPTTGDMVLETSKSFSVSLSQMPVDTAVTLDPASTTINIQDDDSNEVYSLYQPMTANAVMSSHKP